MQSFIISHSPCAEQYGDMSSDTQTHSLTHTIKPPTAGVRQVGHTSINSCYTTQLYAYGHCIVKNKIHLNIRINCEKYNDACFILVWFIACVHARRALRAMHVYIRFDRCRICRYAPAYIISVYRRRLTQYTRGCVYIDPLLADLIVNNSCLASW